MPLLSSRCLFLSKQVRIVSLSALLLQSSGRSVPLNPRQTSAFCQVPQTAVWAHHTKQHFHYGKQDPNFFLITRFCQSLGVTRTQEHKTTSQTYSPNSCCSASQQGLRPDAPCKFLYHGNEMKTILSTKTPVPIHSYPSSLNNSTSYTGLHLGQGLLQSAF